MNAPQPLWGPSEDRKRRSHMSEFIRRAATDHQIADGRGTLEDWEAFRRWSVERRDEFWADMLKFAEIELSAPYRAVTTGTGMLGTRWFAGATLNYARHLLRSDDNEPAIIFENELGRKVTLTHRDLRDTVSHFAAALRRDGVKCGDRVAAFMPNVPETIIAMLAAASLGAIWSSCSPDFGVGGVLDRFGQIEPTVLVACDGYSYGGKRFDCLPRVGEMLQKLPSVKRAVIVPYLAESFNEHVTAPHWSTTAAVSLWRDYLGPPDQPAPPLTFEEVPFDHPLFIMYSSGTTGVPKCIVHGHGGTLIQHMKELMLHTDLHRGERIFYFTTCGWMMWNWLVSSLGVGAAVVLYEGNPGHPDIHHLWDMAARTRLHVFGTSPKFVAACEKADIHPGREHDLSALRCICSTGSPLAVEQFEWIYGRVKADLQLASICGGTDIISCFMLGNPILPVYAGEIQCRGLGMDVQTWNDAGQPVTGEKAELVCCSPFPSQPVCFWNDPDRKKYRNAYFTHDWNSTPDRISASEAPPPWKGGAGGGSNASQPNRSSFPRSDSPPGAGASAPRGEIWRHGDFIELTPRGGIIVYGRSDATLNPGGVRIGTSEIYRLVEAVPEVLDSIVVGKDTPDQDVDIALFLVLRPGHTLTPDLEKRIRDTIAAGATKRHVPKYIRQVTDIPRTISGKKVELAVRQMLHGEPVKNRDALANPEALDQFRAIL